MNKDAFREYVFANSVDISDTSQPGDPPAFTKSERYAGYKHGAPPSLRLVTNNARDLIESLEGGTATHRALQHFWNAAQSVQHMKSYGDADDVDTARKILVGMVELIAERSDNKRSDEWIAETAGVEP